MNLFVLSLNTLSYLLKRLPGYKVGKPDQRMNEITHLFFVDDLKTYAKNENEAKLQLDLISTFSKDINMQMGKEKCAYIYIEKGKKLSLGNTLKMNNIEITELKEGENYTYLGQDEDVGYKDALNKERVTREYYKRIRKIWKSELYSHHKVNAHNTFAPSYYSYILNIVVDERRTRKHRREDTQMTLS